MRRGAPVAAFVIGLAISFSMGVPLAARSVRNAGGPEPEVSIPSLEGVERPEIQVLLSSIDMTVSLIDAYGRCRDDAATHERCMTIIRNTLAHARSLIGR